MPRVSALEGVAYGFRLMGYGAATFVFGTLVMFLGVYLARENQPGMGALALLFGLAILYAGISGTLYKVIADGVAKGNENSESESTATKKTAEPVKRISADDE